MFRVEIYYFTRSYIKKKKERNERGRERNGGTKMENERREIGPVNKEDWIAKTRREKQTAAKTRYRTVGRLAWWL